MYNKAEKMALKYTKKEENKKKSRKKVYRL